MTIPYGRQKIGREDVAQVVRVLRSDWITQGPKIREFEKKLAEYCGARYAVAVSSGTAALHIACLALDIKPGDEVITSPLSFVASANCILYCRAKPIFADIEETTHNIDPNEIKRKITPQTKAILSVHFGGHPCNVSAIHSIARENGLTVIEDGSHALGAEYKMGNQWYRVGGCTHSDVCAFSFHPVKSITTGEGGAVTTNRKDVYEQMLSLRSHGIVRDEGLFENTEMAFWKKNGKKQVNAWYYEMQTLGFNYRITDFQCSLGISQLSRLDSFIQRRRAIAETYNRSFENLDLLTAPYEGEDFKSAYHIYPIKLRLEELSASRAEIYEELSKRGLKVQVHYIPIHFHPYYQRLGYKVGDSPKAEDYYERAITIPLFPAMKAQEIKYVITAVKKVLAAKSRMPALARRIR